MYDRSIIVPVYNGQNKIQDCLNAILVQVRSNDELIVVDNVSIDRTSQQLIEYKRRGVRVLTVGPPSRGLARQFGIENASGRVIVMVDCDCIVEPGWLDEITKPILEGQSKIVIGKTMAIEGTSWGRLAESTEKTFLFQPNEFGQPFNFTSTHFAMDRACLDLLSFDQRLEAAEDFDFGLQCFLKGILISYAEKAVVGHIYLDTLFGHMVKSFSRGFWSYQVYKKYGAHDLKFKEKIRRNKGFEFYRLVYIFPWALIQIAKIVFRSGEIKKSIWYSLCYEVAWQFGALKARVSRLESRGDPLLKVH